ncbi:OmpA family protein [Altererythrobacter sp. SALINAS58]|uniref:OmpA family protein n=1 Tax=Alteripontixanthobacter muriae TaxID=2705546 RepID=UPI001575BE61|nr:OmpA family protein [Alteripontixanthobacter muriae]NTZ43795.1 OmpA family protein [Alteripontixanthobacter muriae]
MLALLLAALLLWWILGSDDDQVEDEVLVEAATEETAIVDDAAPAETTGTGMALTAETVEQANQRMLERLRTNPDTTPRVYHAFDSAELTSGARAILDYLVENRPEAVSESFALSGFADRAAPVPYNRQLSGQRAEQARQYLALQGVETAQIDVEAEGEMPPLVETGDGMREPLNRRVRVEMADYE